MDPIPPAPLEPRDEEVQALQLRQLLQRVGALEHGVAELPGELTQDGNAVDERPLAVVEDTSTSPLR